METKAKQVKLHAWPMRSTLALPSHALLQVSLSWAESQFLSSVKMEGFDLQNDLPGSSPLTLGFFMAEIGRPLVDFPMQIGEGKL